MHHRHRAAFRAIPFIVVATGLHVQGCYAIVQNDGLVTETLMTADAAPPDARIDGAVRPGAPCVGAPGVVPEPDCHIPYSGAGYKCVGTGPCSIAETCGEPLCLAMANNTGPVYDFRMEAIYVTSPPVLSVFGGNPEGNFLQDAVVTAGVTLDAPACGYAAGGTVPPGAFNWLLRVDTSAKTLKTGGGPPVADPYRTGYCFVNDTFSGIHVAPQVAPIRLQEKTFSTSPLPDVLNVPIFKSASDVSAGAIILPIRAAELSQVAISPDGNCIGDINRQWAATAGSTCADTSLATCPKWFTNGALAGHITLKDADAISLSILPESLCVLLVSGSGAHCTATQIASGGDYCSKTHTAGGCKDSVWLSATFAANAVKITAGGSPVCK